MVFTLIYWRRRVIRVCLLSADGHRALGCSVRCICTRAFEDATRDGRDQLLLGLEWGCGLWTNDADPSNTNIQFQEEKGFDFKDHYLLLICRAALQKISPGYCIHNKPISPRSYMRGSTWRELESNKILVTNEPQHRWTHRHQGRTGPTLPFLKIGWGMTRARNVGCAEFCQGA